MSTFRYCHLYNDRLVIYHTHRSPVGQVVIALPRYSGTRTLQDYATSILFDHGWLLGTDRWRKPLDPGKGILATAHLQPRVFGD
jgi:hypothetical protein